MDSTQHLNSPNFSPIVPLGGAHSSDRMRATFPLANDLQENLKLLFSPVRLEVMGLRRQIRSFARQLTGRCLDVGCRGKPYARDIKPFVARHYGIDLVRPADGVGLGPDVLGSAVALPFPNAAFDSVLCTQVLDDVPQPASALNELARVLRPGGVLLLTVPQSWGEHDLPHDYWRFTEPGLRYLLGQSGFQVEAVDRRGGVGSVAAQRLSAFLYYTWGKGRALLLCAPVVAVCSLVQLLGQVIDWFDRKRTDTLGYAVTARLTAGPTSEE
jgi:SAM-dependent methyltransferase